MHKAIAETQEPDVESEGWPDSGRTATPPPIPTPTLRAPLSRPEKRWGRGRLKETLP